MTTAYLSFTHYDLLSPPRWVGLANYRFMFRDDPHLWPAVRNTLWMIVVVRAGCGCCSRSASR